MPTGGAASGSNGNNKAGGAKAATTKGDFTRKAAAIGKDISDTTVKLGRLAECEFGVNVVLY